MLFGRKKTSTIDRRLEELQREMARLGTEIKSAARYAKAGGESSPSAEAAKPRPVPPAAESEPMDAVSVPEGQASAPDADKPVAVPALPGGESAGDLPLFEQRAPLTMTSRERFANYFMAGHFSNLRPLRQEKRIIRNKAIIWSVLVVLALVWLFFFLYYR